MKIIDNKICLVCGCLFYRKNYKSRLESITRWRSRQFCSIKCSQKYTHRKLVNLKGGILRMCIICLKKFERPKVMTRCGLKYVENFHWLNYYKTCGTSCSRKLVAKSNIGRKKTPDELKKQKETWIKNGNKRIFKDTKIEILMQEVLNNRNIPFLKQYVIKKIGIVDLFIPSSNVVIECDGDYWHKRPGRQEKDQIKTEKISSLGYRIYRFWGSEIIKSPIDCFNKIKL